MYRPVTYITITQVGRAVNKTLFFDFCNSFEATDTWVDLTNQGKVTLPKNLYVRDENNKLVSIYGTNNNIGGFDNNNPLFKRGDKISIRFGYRYFRGDNEVLDLPADNKGNAVNQFDGFITEVGSKKPIELKCEDNMYILKQIPAKPQVWKGSVEDLFTNLLSDYPQYTVNKTTSTTIGAFIIQNETVAQLLDRLRKEAHIEAYFRGNELRVGGLVYIESDNVDSKGNAIYKKFVFQQNIISDDLSYKRKDDIVLSAVCISRFEDFTGKTTNDGQAKMKRERLEILIYWDVKTQNFNYIKKEKGKEIPPNVEGERRTLNYINITSEQELFDKGIQNLQKYFYTGFRGKFTTFAIPFVRQGDNVIIEDNILPERNGKYKVRGVEYSGGVNGHRQTITLDYLIT